MTQHTVNLNITNITEHVLTHVHSYFQSGELVDGSSFPQTIPPGLTGQATCAATSLLAGCSGWVEYQLENGALLYFCFSNPFAGKNGIEVGTETSAWDHMSAQYTKLERGIETGSSGSEWLAIAMQSTGGSVNNATWDIRSCDVETILPSNIEVDDVEAVFESLTPLGVNNATRSYYECDPAPSTDIGITKSHFKGISSYGNKLIFTHTNLLALETPARGKMLIADRALPGATGIVAVHGSTEHPGWPHPCSSQACGSFMALGIQQAEDGPGSQTSQVQIWDIRRTKANHSPSIIGVIDIPDDGVNGVGMVREQSGTYLVAALNANTLRVFRSDSISLISNANFGCLVLEQFIEDSGAGLALVAQSSDGAIYMFALNADAGEPSFVTLYKFDLDAAPPACNKVGRMQVDIPGMSASVTLMGTTGWLPGTWIPALMADFGKDKLNSSFRWGKGLKVVSPKVIEIFASDRNSMPIAQNPFTSEKRDFSVVAWNNYAGARKQAGPDVVQSDVYFQMKAQAGVILLVPVSESFLLTTLNIMLHGMGQGLCGKPIVMVFDYLPWPSGDGGQYTPRQTSAVVGLNPSICTEQNLTLETPMYIQAGQAVGILNTGPAPIFLQWVDGTAHYLYNNMLPPDTWTTGGQGGGIPCNACGWNLTGIS